MNSEHIREQGISDEQMIRQIFEEDLKPKEEETKKLKEEEREMSEWLKK